MILVALGLVLFVACLALWIGTPVLWLWLGSLIQGATGNVGAAIGAMIFGVALTIIMMVPVLSFLTRAYQRARAARGLEDTGAFPLEVAMTCSAVLAIAFIVVWFTVLEGASKGVI